MPLIELLQKHDEGDFLRAVIEAVLQTLMEHDVEGRQTYRSGYRDRELKTRMEHTIVQVSRDRQIGVQTELLPVPWTRR